MLSWGGVVRLFNVISEAGSLVAGQLGAEAPEGPGDYSFALLQERYILIAVSRLIITTREIYCRLYIIHEYPCYY